MSGFFGSLVDLSVSALSGPAPVVIGGLVLRGHEVPGRIVVGGAQAVTVHKLPGGGRIIDAMGRDDNSIVWRGVFVGPDAAQRARAVDAMRQQGTPRTLSFGDYTFNVVIVHFEYDYQDRGAVVSYRIKSEILPDCTDPSAGVGGLGVALQGDLVAGSGILASGAAAALTYAGLGGRRDAATITAAAYGLASTATGLGSAATLVAATGAADLATSPALRVGLENAGLTLQGAIAGLSNGALAGSAAGIDLTSASGLALATAQAAALAAAVRVGARVNRAGANVARGNAQPVAPYVHA